MSRPHGEVRFMLGARLEAVAAVVVLVGVLVGCGDEATGGSPLPGVPYESPAPPGQQNDPAVTAAAERLDSLLRASRAGPVLNVTAATSVRSLV